MADYKAIKGWAIHTVSSAPSNPILGQVWYNSTLGKIKVAKTSTGAWASGGDVNTERAALTGTGADNEAVIIFGGNTIHGARQAVAETYDGSSWTEVGDLNQARHNPTGNIGTVTAALAVAGGPLGSITNNAYDIVEQWNGTSWTEIADINTSRFSAGGSGTTTAAIIFGGDSAAQPGGYGEGETESWNGTSWTEVNDMNNARNWHGDAGKTSDAAIAIGGGPGNIAHSETWDGSSWSETNNLNTGRRYIQAFGTSTSALGASGYVTAAAVANCEEWNGSSWAEVADVSTARFLTGHGGSYASGLIASGDSGAPLPAPGQRVATEEWTGDSVTAANVDVT